MKNLEKATANFWATNLLLANIVVSRIKQNLKVLHLFSNFHKSPLVEIGKHDLITNAI